jgi:diadenosine tetraphosphatase ApaH/serine/threonine PP2A family protein phosphatase
MLIALMSDIHGNREAFSACLAHAKEASVDRYVFLGDYVGYGADPGWAVDKIMALVRAGAIAIMGNHDQAVGSSSGRMNPVAQEAIEWTRRQLNDGQRSFLAGLPMTQEEDDRFFVHASAATPELWEYVLGMREAARCLRATQCRHTFCGHVHVPALFHQTSSGKVGAFTPIGGVRIPLLPNRRWLVVLGAVGQPRDGNPAACYGLFDDEREILTYTRVAYDVESAARKIRQAGLPLVLSTRLVRGT